MDLWHTKCIHLAGGIYSTIADLAWLCRRSTMTVMEGSGLWRIWDCFWRVQEVKRCETPLHDITLEQVGGHYLYPPCISQATDKLFDDMHWLIVHSLKAVQVSTVHSHVRGTELLEFAVHSSYHYIAHCISHRMWCLVIGIALNATGKWTIIVPIRTYWWSV